VLTAALKFILSIGCRAICTTHFLEVFSLGLLVDGCDGVKALQMAVHIPDSKDDDAVPLFRLEEGVANSSAGLVCAKMAGVHLDVISRAQEIIAALNGRNPVKPIAANLNSHATFRQEEKDALRCFLGVSEWANQSEGMIDVLNEKVKAI
jgi:DNA mismatch repair protein MSH5